MVEDESEEKEIQQTEEDEITQEAWWRESAFVIEDAPHVIMQGAPIPKVGNLFDSLKDIVPSLRQDGELTLLGRTFTGFTEWIPGVDPVGEMISESWLPPLPPAVTTRMRTFEDEEGELPGGGGHLNMMVDLSGSMSRPIGVNASFQEMSIKKAAMLMCHILINGCQAGGHTFAIGGYGSDSNNITAAKVKSKEPYWERLNSYTRLIWGANDPQRRDYQGAKALIENEYSDSGNELWDYMHGTRSGAGMARMYHYMKEMMKGTEITSAPCIFLSDCLPYDLTIQSKFYDLIDGNVDRPVLKTMKMEKEGKATYDSTGFWYWAKKYSQEFGPVILIQMIDQKNYKKKITEQNPGYLSLIQAGFVQFIGEGRPPNEYEKCFMSEPVFMSATGGNLVKVAGRMNEFIKNMNGEGEICCGGKGISF